MAEIPHYMKITAEFSNEMLEQIRAVVREELQAALKPPITWSAGSLTSEELTERLKDWKPKIQVRDTSTDVSSTVTYPVTIPATVAFPNAHGPSITAELEHQGKLYKGILYFVKDVD